jgi:hypothetical protein
MLGTGSANYLPKFTGASTIGNSSASDNGTTFDVSIQGKFTGLSGGRVITLNAPTDGGSLTFETGGTAYADMGSNKAILGTGSATNFYLGTRAGYSLALGTANVARLFLDTSGNLGLGVTPSAWNSGAKVLQVSNAGLYAGTTFTNLGSNIVWTSIGNSYISNGFASLYAQEIGEHRFYTAPSGTAGNAITFTQAMTLTSDGNLLLGTPTNAGFRLAINGPDGASYVKFTSPSATTGGRIGYNGNELRIDQQENADLVLRTNGSTRLTIDSTGAATFTSSVSATKFKTPGFVEPTSVKGLFNNTNYSGPAWNNASLVTGNGATGVMMGGDAGLYAYGWIQGVQTDTGGVKGLYLNPLGGAVTVGGAATFSSSVDVNGSYLQMGGSGLSAPPAALNYGLFPQSSIGLGLSSLYGMTFWTGTTPAERMRITSTGIACFACPLYVCANGSAFGTAAGSGQAMTIQAGSNCRAIIFKNAGGGDGSLWLYGTSNSIDYSFSTYSVGSAFYLCNNGNYDFYGSDISDRRQKDNICYITDSQIYNIMKLKSVSFNKKTLMGGLNSNVHTGFIAQDVLEAGIPNLVHGKEEEGYGLDYNGILSLAVKSIQEQQCTICSQASMINTLKTCLGII